MARQDVRKQFTSANPVYNTGESALELGYVQDNGGFIRISPTTDEARGQDAVAGEKMYRYSDGILVTLDMRELAIINEILPLLASGKLAHWKVRHRSGNNANQLELATLEGGAIKISVTTYDRDNQDRIKAGPFVHVIEPRELDGSDGVRVNPDFLVLKVWALEALRVCTRGMFHYMKCPVDQMNFGTKQDYREDRGGYRDDDDRGGYQRGGGGSRDRQYRQGSDRGGYRDDDRGGSRGYRDDDRGGGRDSDRDNPRRPGRGFDDAPPRREAQAPRGGAQDGRGLPADGEPAEGGNDLVF